MPPFQFNDEHGHFVRAYQISRGQFIAREGETLPPSVLALVRGFPEGTDHKFSWREISGALKTVAVGSGDSEAPSDGPGQRYFMWAVRASRLYPPIVYLPASTGIFIARALGFSPLGMLYAARSMNVMCFVIAVWLVLSMVPDCRSLITAVALMPMTLHQAAAVSADQVTIALSLVAIGMVLHTREHKVGAPYLASTLIVFTLLVLSKNSYWALPLLLLIPAQRFCSRRVRWAYLAFVVIVAVGAVYLWNRANHDSLVLFRNIAASKGIDPQANAAVLVNHPFRVLTSLSPHGILKNLGHVSGQFVAAFGWTMFGMPVWTRLLFLSMLIAVALLEPMSAALKPSERLLLAADAIGALVGTYVVLFIVDGKYADGRYSFWSAGVQGRYLIPYCMVGLLALKQQRVTVQSATLAPIATVACVVYALASLVRIVTVYY